MKRPVKGAARKKFKRGDRVVTTPDYAEWFKRDSRNAGPYSGTVVGFSKDGALVRVRKDGNKAGGSYHADFWGLCPTIEDFFFPLQKTIATGLRLPVVVPVGNTKIESVVAYAADTVQAGQLVKLVTPEVSLATSGRLSVAWSRVRSSLRGIKSKLLGDLKELRIWWSR